MTLLGILNRVLHVLTRGKLALAHEVYPHGANTRHVWWTGRHVGGSWHWRSSPGWERS